MSLEYTKQLYGQPFKDVRIALNENSKNFLNESTTTKYNEIIEKLLYRPDLICRYEEFGLLLELAAETRKLWLNHAELKVFFFGGQDARTQRVIEIASQWSKFCRIQFVPTSKVENAQIRVSFQEPTSWSYIGTDAKGVKIQDATMNFGWLNIGTPDEEWNRVVLHEFGHALGLIHEHQSPAVKMVWNKAYVYWYCNYYMQWTRNEVDRNIFMEYDEMQTNHTEVDIHSIMAYQVPSQFIITGKQFPLNSVLSAIDQKHIGNLYR